MPVPFFVFHTVIEIKEITIINHIIQDQVEWGFEKSGLVESAPAHGRGIGVR